MSASERRAFMTTFVPGRKLDDDGNVLLRYTNGARGVLISSQVEIGCENDLRIRVFGSQGSLSWRQEDPNRLLHAPTVALREAALHGDGELARTIDKLFATRDDAGHDGREN